MNLVEVQILVLENGQEVGHATVRYFPGQPYTVKVDTPDGVDTQVSREAGAA